MKTSIRLLFIRFIRQGNNSMVSSNGRLSKIKGLLKEGLWTGFEIYNFMPPISRKSDPFLVTGKPEKDKRLKRTLLFSQISQFIILWASRTKTSNPELSREYFLGVRPILPANLQEK